MCESSNVLLSCLTGHVCRRGKANRIALLPFPPVSRHPARVLDRSACAPVSACAARPLEGATPSVLAGRGGAESCQPCGPGAGVGSFFFTGAKFKQGVENGRMASRQGRAAQPCWLGALCPECADAQPGAGRAASAPPIPLPRGRLSSGAQLRSRAHWRQQDRLPAALLAPPQSYGHPRPRSRCGRRARVDHPFRGFKRQFGYVKTRHRGLAKNRAQIFTLFARGNLFLVRRRLRTRPQNREVGAVCTKRDGQRRSSGHLG